MIDLTGQTFDRLTVIRLDHTNRRAFWLCQCSCGKTTVVATAFLRNGHTSSCGCKTRFQKKHGHTHNHRGTPTYKSWRAMIQRCYRPKSGSYRYYGGLGVEVCDRWRHSFENFLADLGERPEGMTLDRERAEGNYEPGNCRWATAKQQRSNQRSK